MPAPCQQTLTLPVYSLTHAIGLNDVCDALQMNAGVPAAVRGATPPSRNTLSHANKVRDCRMAEALYWATMEHLMRQTPGFARGKEPDNRRAHEVCAGLASGEIAVFDKAYVDFEHLWDLTGRGVWWVSRAKDNMQYRVVERLKTTDNPRIVTDELILLISMKYEKSHPRITFSLRLPPDDYRLWLLLGEVASKIQHLSGVPLRPDVAADLHAVYLAKGVLATTAIEGNTLSEEQVRALVDGTLELPKSQRYLQQEVQNIIDVCNREARELLGPDGSDRRLCRALIEQYNRDVLKGLELSEGTVPGIIREHSVLVGNVYRGAPAEDCEYLLERLCTWLNSEDFSPADEELRIPLALIKAIVAHMYLAWIHPFGDGNGRTARLIEFHVLFANGIPLPAAHLLSDHYNLTRSQYYRELAKASATGGDLLPFINYVLRGFLDGIRDQIARIRDQQMRVAWENYVHDRFRAVKNSPTQKRRRDLVFDLTDHGEWVEVAAIPLLTPTLAREYATAGERMVQRDLNALAKMELISRRHGKVLANWRTIQAYLPRRVEEQAERSR